MKIVTKYPAASASAACVAGPAVRATSAATHAVRTASAICAVVFAALAAVLVASLLLTGCSSGAGSSGPTWGRLSTYLDDNALSAVGERVSYAPGGKACQTGVDVSEHQGYIDWEAVAADGISFAFVRLGDRGSTEGGLYIDDYAEYNIASAQAAGIQVHAYFYSQALNVQEAREEADFAIATARAYGLSGCYVAFDLETETGRAASLSSQDEAEVANAFCQRIADAGFKPLIYGNRDALTNFGESTCTGWPIWLASYTLSNPRSPCPFVIWQYASDGTVAGIDTDVDLNIWVAS